MYHNYPHCWRTDKPVLYYPLDDWFIIYRSKRAHDGTEQDYQLEAESTGTGRFGKWLENLNDWNLSRSVIGGLRCLSGAVKKERGALYQFRRGIV